MYLLRSKLDELEKVGKYFQLNYSPYNISKIILLYILYIKLVSWGMFGFAFLEKKNIKMKSWKKVGSTTQLSNFAIFLVITLLYSIVYWVGKISNLFPTLRKFPTFYPDFRVLKGNRI